MNAPSTNFFGSLAKKLSSHETIEQKFDNLYDIGRKLKSLKSAKPPDPTSTTEVGEYFDNTGALRLTTFFGNVSAFFQNDVRNIQHKTALRRYRETSLIPEAADAIEEYDNEIIVHDPKSPNFVKLDFINKDIFSEDLRDEIYSEWDYIIGPLLDFKNNAHSMIHKFNTDGILYVEKVYDVNYLHRGVIDVNVIDPMCLTYVQAYSEDPETKIRSMQDSFYVFKYDGDNRIQPEVNPFQTVQFINYGREFVLPKESIARADSGIVHPFFGYPLSFLDKAVKVANQLKLLEDAILVYRITRAPERRVFYIDTADLPPAKAEQFIQEMIKNHRTEKLYDTQTGTLDSGAAVLSMIEDFWLPRQNGRAVTEVSTLTGAQNLGEIKDLDFFYKKLWKALGVPYTRRMAAENGGISFGTGTAITVDELKMHQTVQYRRRRFESIFVDLLMTQLVTKQIINTEDADSIAANFCFQWNENNYFYERLRLENIEKKIDVMSRIDEKAMAHISMPWISKNIMGFTVEEIEQLRDERAHPEKYGFESTEKEEESPEEGFGGGLGGGFGVGAAGVTAGAPGEGNLGAELESLPTEEETPETTPEAAETFGPGA